MRSAARRAALGPHALLPAALTRASECDALHSVAQRSVVSRAIETEIVAHTAQHHGSAAAAPLPQTPFRFNTFGSSP